MNLLRTLNYEPCINLSIEIDALNKKCINYNCKCKSPEFVLKQIDKIESIIRISGMHKLKKDVLIFTDDLRESIANRQPASIVRTAAQLKAWDQQREKMHFFAESA